MKKINKQHFLNYLESFIISEDKVPEIEKTKVNEFKIGKSFFYSLKDETILKFHDWLNEYFLKEIELNDVVTSFRDGYSYLDFFEPHRFNYNFIRLDIQSFFHSIQLDDVRKVFRPYFDDNLIKESSSQTFLDAFINMISYKVPTDSLNAKFKGSNVLPMGFKTSPLISNIVFRQLDIQLQKYCAFKNVEYTRYADDMLFSSKKNYEFIFSETFINEIRIILNQMKFKINKDKTLIARHTLSLNGYTIEYSKNEIFSNKKVINELRFSNKRLTIINKLIYMKSIKKIESKIILKKLFQFDFNFNKFWAPVTDNKLLNKYYDDQLKNKITGYRSYLLSLIKFNERHQCTTESTIKKYFKLINKLEKILNDLN